MSSPSAKYIYIGLAYDVDLLIITPTRIKTYCIASIRLAGNKKCGKDRSLPPPITLRVYHAIVTAAAAATTAAVVAVAVAADAISVTVQNAVKPIISLSSNAFNTKSMNTRITKQLEFK
uniref:Uncharacterized protein n=1 Tax=Glossina pallidipes TaxID=7398 RepID=A0A1B0ABL3_GLOPL